jgi:glycosyltransferase involved in cell wall biosynthesis
MAGLSIILACFNEEDVIESCLERIVRTVPEAEVLVVHGGTDHTADRAEKLARHHPQIRVIRNKDDQGKGHAIKVGCQQASHDLMLQFDADLQYSPEEIPLVLAPLLVGKADLAFGCRFMKDSNVTNYKFSFFRVIGNHVVNRYVSFLTGQRFYDITTGYKAWTRKAINEINFQDNKFVYEAEIAVRGAMKGLRFAMVPITYYNRLGGISGHGSGLQGTWSVIRTGFKILFYCTRLRLTG